MAGGVICSIGRSSDAARVAAVAADVARQLGLRLVVADAGSSGRPARDEAFLEGIAEAVGLHGAELLVQPGDPISATLELAGRETAELIVVSRRDGAWPELVERASCPVLVVPTRADASAQAEEAVKGPS